MASALEVPSEAVAMVGDEAGSLDPRRRVRQWLEEGLGCSACEAGAAASALGVEAAARALEALLCRRADAVEVLGEELRRAGPEGEAAQRSSLRSFGLVLQELPEEDLEGAYWAEKFDELSGRSAGSFNTLHRYSCDVSNTPFPVVDVLDALRRPLEEDFGLAPEELRLHAAFFIHYGSGWNRDLRRHVDNSLITVNLCLRTTEELAGCGVRFFGPRQLRARADIEGRAAGVVAADCSALVDVPPGCALIHWGDHEHETAPWVAGERWSVILWFKEK